MGLRHGQGHRGEAQRQRAHHGILLVMPSKLETMMTDARTSKAEQDAALDGGGTEADLDEGRLLP